MHGPGRNDSIHGDEDWVGIPADIHADALSDVVNTVMLFGEYPQPTGNKVDAQKRKRFDMYEWAREHVDAADMCDLYVSVVCGTADDYLHMQRLAREMKRVEAALTEHLRDSEIVDQRAAEMAEDE